MQSPDPPHRTTQPAALNWTLIREHLPLEGRAETDIGLLARSGVVIRISH